MGNIDRPPVPTLGASGGVFGLLLAFGMAFPQRRIMLLFPPIPMPAWLFVTLYGLLELYLGVTGHEPGCRAFRASRRHGRRVRAADAWARPGPASAERGVDHGEGDGKRHDARPSTSKTAAEEAVRVLLRWAGEDPGREGLRDTPRRVVSCLSRLVLAGTASTRVTTCSRTFEETAGYDEMVVLRDIEFESHCEHHMAPIIGRAHVGYLPTDRVVGISKLARVVDVYARRFQVQEKMTAEIAALHQRRCCGRAASAS